MMRISRKDIPRWTGANDETVEISKVISTKEI